VVNESGNAMVEGYRSGVILLGALPERFLAGRMSESLTKVVTLVGLLLNRDFEMCGGAEGDELAPRYPRLSRSQDSKLVANNHLLHSN
jgi:hypothetical protein